MRAFLLVLTVMMGLNALAEMKKGEEPTYQDKPLKPATRYSGSTPIDLSNGLLFNNGTYGIRNSEYEAWAKAPAVVAGLSTRPYSYVQRKSFITTLREQIAWGEASIANWKSTSNEYPDAVAYAKGAEEKMQPLLDHLKSETDKADGANESEWQGAESASRRALIDFRIAYMQMHKNVQAREQK